MIPFNASNLMKTKFDRELHVVRSLLYYDRDLVLLIRDEEKNDYIGHFKYYECKEELWYLTSVGPIKLKELLKGEADLLTTIEESPERYVIRVTAIGGAGEIMHNECYDGSEVPHDYLPSRGFRFFNDEFTDINDAI